MSVQSEDCPYLTAWILSQSALRIVELLEGHALLHRRKELGAVDLRHGQALVLEELDQFLLIRLDLRRGARCSLLAHITKDLLLFRRELGPGALGDNGVEVIDDMAGQHDVFWTS